MAMMRYQPQARRGTALALQSAGCKLAFNAGSQVDAATGTPSINVFKASPSPVGLAVGPFTAGPYPSFATMPIKTSGSFTVLVCGVFVYSNGYAPLISHFSSGNGWKFSTYNNAIAYTQYGVADYTSVTSIAGGYTGVMAIVVTPGVNVKFYKGGVLADTIAIGAMVGGTGTLVIGNRSGGTDTPSASQIAGAYYIESALSDSQIASLSQNFWQPYTDTLEEHDLVNASGATASQPGSGAFSLTGFAPNIVQTGSKSIAPSNGAFALTGYAPTVSQSGAAVAMPSITFSSKDGNAATNVPVTFGQVFAVGAVPSGGFLQLTPATGPSVPCQVDAKAFHPDGTVRHAILSAIIPSIPATGTVAYAIATAASGPTGSTVVPANFPGLNATVTLTDMGTDVSGPITGTQYTADASAQLAGGTYEVWLSGPIVSEWIVRAPLKDSGGTENPDLHARFSIRAYAGQSRAKIDYIVESCWAKPLATPANQSPWANVSVTDHIYTFSLKAGATTVYNRAVGGKQTVRFANNSTVAGSGTYDATATGLANDATVYTATISVNGSSMPISITGSAAQTYGALKSLLNTQLGSGATCVSDATFLGVDFKSTTTGVTSYVKVTDYGTLFPALGLSTNFRAIRGDEVVHYARTRWKKTYWWGTEPQAHIAHDKAYLIATYALPNYPSDLVGDAATIASRLSTINSTSDIGDNGLSKPWMGDYGYAPGIGILPEWCAMYAVNQGIDAKYVMLKQADLHGSWPVCIRDYNTDKPISFENWPYATHSPSAGDSLNSATGLYEKLPVISAAAALPPNRMAPEVSHHPDFCYLPYMVTGDHFYMEGMLFYQRWTTLDENAEASYRDGRRSLWKVTQPRGQAWCIRTAAHTAWLMPTSHPLRNDILYQMDQNAAWYNTNMVSSSGAYNSVLGVFAGPGTFAYDMNGATFNGFAPWQDAFVTASCGRAVELGFTGFSNMFTYKAQFQIKLLTSGTAFCWQAASIYKMQMKDTSTGPLYTTMNQIYQASATPETLAATCGTQAMATALGVPLGAMSGYPDEISGFPANLQPAVAYASTNALPGGSDAWTVFDARTTKPNYNLGPQFAIAPRTAAAVVTPPTTTVTSVTVSPATATGSTVFSAVVNGTGSPSQSVNWTTNGGSVNSSGSFTAPMPTSSVQTITVTATSAADNTKSGTATVTIAALAPHVTPPNITAARRGRARSHKRR